MAEEAEGSSPDRTELWPFTIHLQEVLKINGNADGYIILLSSQLLFKDLWLFTSNEIYLQCKFYDASGNQRNSSDNTVVIN